MKFTIILSFFVFRRIIGLPLEDKVPSEEDIEKCEKKRNAFNANVPYYNPSKNEFECTPILEKGPCRTGERIVLELLEDKTVRAVCKKDPCPPQDGQNRVLYEEDCVDVYSIHACKDECCKIIVNAYGKGECDCTREIDEQYEHLKLEGTNNGTFTCHERCDISVCDAGEFLYHSEDDKSIGQCTPCCKDCTECDTWYPEVDFEHFDCTDIGNDFSWVNPECQICCCFT